MQQSFLVFSIGVDRAKKLHLFHEFVCLRQPLSCTKLSAGKTYTASDVLETNLENYHTDSELGRERVVYTGRGIVPPPSSALRELSWCPPVLPPKNPLTWGFGTSGSRRQLTLSLHEAQARRKALDQSPDFAPRRERCRVRPDAAPHRAGSIFPSLGDRCRHYLAFLYGASHLRGEVEDRQADGGQAITCRGITIERTFSCF